MVMVKIMVKHSKRESWIRKDALDEFQNKMEMGTWNDYTFPVNNDRRTWGTDVT